MHKKEISIVTTCKTDGQSQIINLASRGKKI